MAFPTDRDLRLQALCALYLRPCVTVSTDAGVTFEFTPPLSSAELVTFADLETMARSTFTASMTLPEYQNIKPFLASEVTWQAITRNAFVNLAEADMRRAV